MFKIQIDETGRNSLKGEVTAFNFIVEYKKNLKEIKQYLIDRYGKMPNMKHKIHYEFKDKSKPDEKNIGFTHSFWNQDISHMTPKWYQTDWITVFETHSKPININLLKG